MISLQDFRRSVLEMEKSRVTAIQDLSNQLKEYNEQQQRQWQISQKVEQEKVAVMRELSALLQQFLEKQVKPNEQK